MKTTFVFVGSAPSHMMGVVSFTAFGQRVELTEEQARDLAMGGSAIVPAAAFDALGVTVDELRKYGPFGSHAAAPAEFVEKRVAAIVAHDEFRGVLEAALEDTEEVA